MSEFNIGTCSWKYESWKGIIYPEFGDFNYLEEYCKSYNSVEIDQWFWSLHPNNKITLPNPNVVEEYNNISPDNFSFTIKVPNSITLTHPYKSSELNKYFLSMDLMEAFLDSIKPLKAKVGMLIFQFEYLNKKKINSQDEFQFKLEEFFSPLNRDYNYAIEIRNPNYLNEKFFTFLNNHKISFVFLHGYYMPPIYETYKNYCDLIKNAAVIRLLGFDRKGIEKKTNKIWNALIDPQDEDIDKIVDMLISLKSKEVDLYMNVNNHFEGSAPLTIKKLEKILSEAANK